MTKKQLLAKKQEVLESLKRKQVADTVVSAISDDLTRIITNLKDDTEVKERLQTLTLTVEKLSKDLSLLLEGLKKNNSARKG